MKKLFSFGILILLLFSSTTWAATGDGRQQSFTGNSKNDMIALYTSGGENPAYNTLTNGDTYDIMLSNGDTIRYRLDLTTGYTADGDIYLAPVNISLNTPYAGPYCWVKMSFDVLSLKVGGATIDGLVDSVGGSPSHTKPVSEYGVSQAITNAGGGTIGGTLGTVDNAVPRANGAGGVTAQGSFMTVDDSGSPNIPTGQHYKINSANLAAADVGAVPTSRTVNGHALSSDVSVTASDVGLGSVTNAEQIPKSAALPFSLTVKSPASGGEDHFIAQIPWAATISSIHMYNIGGTNTVANIRIYQTLGGTYTSATTSDQTVTGTTNVTTINNSAIGAGYLLFLHITSTSGTPNEFGATVDCTMN